MPEGRARRPGDGRLVRDGQGGRALGVGGGQAAPTPHQAGQVPRPPRRLERPGDARLRRQQLLPQVGVERDHALLGQEPVAQPSIAEVTEYVIKLQGGFFLLVSPKFG